MELHNEFTISAPLERTWETLLDIERVGGRLPGATIQPASGDGLYRGRMLLKLGSVTVDYEGSARVIETDEDAHTTVMAVQGRETKGHSTVAATIVNSLHIGGEGDTRVSVDTDLHVTGRQAQFGRGILEEMAGRMLTQFAGELETLIASRSQSDVHLTATAPVATRYEARRNPDPRSDTRADDALDVFGIVRGSVRRHMPALAAVALLAIVLGAARSRRRKLSLGFDLSL